MNVNSCISSSAESGSLLVSKQRQIESQETSNNAGSYLQVVVQAMPVEPRVPIASSPLRPPCVCFQHLQRTEAASPEPPVRNDDRTTRATAPERGRDGVNDGGGGDDGRSSPFVNLQKNSTSKIWDHIVSHKLLYEEDCSADCVEAFVFERGVEVWALTARSPAPPAWLRRLRRTTVAAARASATVPAAAALLLEPPRTFLLALLRCALVSTRDCMEGAAGVVADSLLKPALALAFNAGARPMLVLAWHAARALRDVARPVAAALLLLAEPLAQVLAAVRLVHIHVNLPAPAPATDHV
ncbi:hypothetical protein ACJJTC_016793 [Scirpophaga incertulas]